MGGNPDSYGNRAHIVKDPVQQLVRAEGKRTSDDEVSGRETIEHLGEARKLVRGPVVLRPWTIHRPCDDLVVGIAYALGIYPVKQRHQMGGAGYGLGVESSCAYERYAYNIC